MRVYRAGRKQLALDAYGGKCVCCGESRAVFLGFDHVVGGGTAERREKRKSPYTYEQVIKEGFPDRFRVLCHNCNWATHVGVCPHQEEQ